MKALIIILRLVRAIFYTLLLPFKWVAKRFKAPKQRRVMYMSFTDRVNFMYKHRALNTGYKRTIKRTA